MFIIHLWELFLISVVYEGSVVATSKGLMDINDCKRSTSINSNKPNVRNDLDDDLFLQMPLMSHKGCFYDKGSWDATAIYKIDWDITSSCSCKCWKKDFFALRGNQCACLNSLLDIMETGLKYCNYTCPGSKKDPCGAANVFTVYEHKVKTIPTNTKMQPSLSITHHNSISRISTSALYTELTTEANDINMETSLSTSPMKTTVISGISTTASPGSRQPVSGMTTNVAELTTEAKETNKETSMSTTPLKKTVISRISTTGSPETREAFFKTTTYVTVITVVGALIAIVVILLLYRRKRKRIIYHSRNSASNDMHASLEGEQTMQMFSSNDRSRNRTNTVPFILQQKQRPGNISVSNYQDPVDMENQYQRLNFSMRSDLKEGHDDYAMQFCKQTSTPVVNDDGLKPYKAGLTKATKDLKEEYNNYSLPYDSLSHPPEVRKDDTKLQIKTRPSITTIDEKHNNVAYCDTAIVHEDVLYDIPKLSSKSLDN